MAHHSPHRSASAAVGPDFDLVEYLLIGLPGLAGVDGVAEAIGRLVNSDRIRILDLAVVISEASGDYRCVEPDAVAGMEILGEVDGEFGGLLSADDIAMACSELPIGTSAVILVAEDRWAHALADAARSAGGRIVGGERVPRHRMQAAMSASWHDEFRGQRRKAGT